MSNVVGQMVAKMIVPRGLHGIGYAAACAAIFSVNTICARIAFQEGADAPTGNALRFAFTVFVLVLVAAIRRNNHSLTRRQRLGALALGVPFFVGSFGYMTAIEYIPVSIAVLVLYTFPILVGLIARFAEGERLGPSRFFALAIAFVGLALALDVRSDAMPDWRGLTFALIAACGMSMLIVGSSRVMQGADRGAVNLHLMLLASALFVIALFAGGGPVWPKTELGWAAMAGLLATFAAGQLTLIAAIGRAGPVATAAVMNLEPLVTTALAVMLVGEKLTLTHFAGAALVVIAIFLMSRSGRAMPVPIAEP